MSREKFGRAKQSSTLSAREVYEFLIADGYVPLLIEGRRPLHSLKWDAVKNNRDVSRSNSGNSIHLVDGTNKGRPLIDLKTSAMMSVASIGHLERLTSVQMKPSP